MVTEPRTGSLGPPGLPWRGSHLCEYPSPSCRPRLLLRRASVLVSSIAALFGAVIWGATLLGPVLLLRVTFAEWCIKVQHRREPLERSGHHCLISGDRGGNWLSRSFVLLCGLFVLLNNTFHSSRDLYYWYSATYPESATLIRDGPLNPSLFGITGSSCWQLAKNCRAYVQRVFPPHLPPRQPEVRISCSQPGQRPSFLSCSSTALPGGSGSDWLLGFLTTTWALRERWMEPPSVSPPVPWRRRGSSYWRQRRSRDLPLPGRSTATQSGLRYFYSLIFSAFVIVGLRGDGWRDENASAADRRSELTDASVSLPICVSYPR